MDKEAFVISNWSIRCPLLRNLNKFFVLVLVLNK